MPDGRVRRAQRARRAILGHLRQRPEGARPGAARARRGGSTVLVRLPLQVLSHALGTAPTAQLRLRHARHLRRPGSLSRDAIEPGFERHDLIVRRRAGGVEADLLAGDAVEAARHREDAGADVLGRVVPPPERVAHVRVPRLDDGLHLGRVPAGRGEALLGGKPVDEADTVAGVDDAVGPLGQTRLGRLRADPQRELGAQKPRHHVVLGHLVQLRLPLGPGRAELVGERSVADVDVDGQGGDLRQLLERHLVARARGREEAATGHVLPVLVPDALETADADL
ncbi:MAG: hypothetical protein ACK559_15920, partial [bacterium]